MDGTSSPIRQVIVECDFAAVGGIDPGAHGGGQSRRWNHDKQARRSGPVRPPHPRREIELRRCLFGPSMLSRVRTTCARRKACRFGRYRSHPNASKGDDADEHFPADRHVTQTRSGG